jgi:predicted ATPase
VRLLTLTGPGGVGKTRLSLKVARDVAGSFADGVAFVDLTEVADPTRFAPTVAHALGLQDTGNRSPFDLLLAHLHEKDLLLVLDNFERVTTAALLLVRLLAWCPRLKSLVTSRVALMVRGEQRFVVQPLETPAPSTHHDAATVEGSPAVALFVERARAVDPTFQLTDANAAAVAEICVRLDGLPLAIELSASRASLLPPEALLTRLSSGLGLLEGGAPDAPERQQTMRGAIVWSYDLLNEDKKALLRRLSVFEGGWTIEAAEAVCAERGESLDVLGGLSSLVDASLLRREMDDEPRLRMLAVIREHARELLVESGEADATRGRHAGYFVGLSGAAESALFGPDHAAWLERLEREHDNLRAALGWARETGDVETGLCLAGSLCEFWWTRGHLGEGRRWVEWFLSEGSKGEGQPARAGARAKALYGSGLLAHGQGDNRRAAAFYEEALGLYRELGDQAGTTATLLELGSVNMALGDYDRAEDLSAQGLALSRTSGDDLSAAIASGTLGRVARHRGDAASAVSRFEESLDLYGKVGYGRGRAYALANLGFLALESGDAERAQALQEQSLDLYQELKDKAGRAYALTNLADAAHERGDKERATALYEEALALQRELGNERGAARALAGLTTGR